MAEMLDSEDALSRYLETFEADKIFGNYFDAIRKAFIAGYRAAGGIIPKEQKTICILPVNNKKYKT